MKESFIHFVWQYQHLDGRALKLTSGEDIQVLSPGTLNTHQGPDFLDARLRIGEACWAGAVELHVQASDWDRHAHASDRNYRNVILHVVWKDDGVDRGLPTLVLDGHVPGNARQRWENWMQTGHPIPCHRQLQRVEAGIRQHWMTQLTEQRLRKKNLLIETYLGITRGDWEEVAWWLIARAFGGPVNGAAFEMIARSLPLTMLARQAATPHRIEALLLGQAGLLTGAFSDEYPRALQQDYAHISKMLGLRPMHMPIYHLRMRPHNFPAPRLAQLARLISVRCQWLSILRESDHPATIRSLMDTRAASYWDEHIIPGRQVARRTSRAGSSILNSVLINAFIPILYAYGLRRREPVLVAKAVRWLQSLPAEQNAIVKDWGQLGLPSAHAGDSQALLELRKYYCVEKKCLSCAIGQALLASGR